MEYLLDSLSLTLFVLAVINFILIIRDTFTLLDSEDQNSLRDYWIGPAGFSEWRKRDRAVRRAWNEHARRFPKSHKRMAFALLLIFAAISLMGYPLWYALGSP